MFSAHYLSFRGETPKVVGVNKFLKFQIKMGLITAETKAKANFRTALKPGTVITDLGRTLR